MTREKTIKQKEDFYSENTNFSDDPQDSFYATSDDEAPSKKHSKKQIFGFYKWELAVIIIEILLIIYILLVFAKIVPLV